MSQTLQLEKITTIRELHDAPKLLVEWSPRWEEFVTSIGPAFARSGPRLAGEAGYGEFPYRGLAASLLLQFFVLVAALLLPREIDRLRPYAAPRLQPDEVIYYSGDELPRTEDLGGSQAGSSGRAGGREAHHRTQTIRIARGSSLAAKVVDAPNLKLPSSSAEVANLLAFKSTPAAPSAEGLHSSLTAPALAANVIPPAPDAARSRSRRGVHLDSVIAPAPSVFSNGARPAPSLNAAVVPPAPVVYNEHTLIAPVLDPSIIAPAPKVSGQHRRAAPSLNANVIAPAPSQVADDQARSNRTLDARVIPPAPSSVDREVPSTRVQMTNVTVVPPPVSAPERESARTAKLNLPAPSVVAPPPSADSSRDLRRLESGSGSVSPSVVPPPPSQAPSFVSSIIGKIFGPQEVVPPPPSVSSTNRTSTGGLAANVVPPPPSVSAGNRNVGSGALAAKVVPPAPLNANGVSGGTSRMSPRGPSTNIVPPPPSVTGSDSAAGVGTSERSSSSARLDASIVPPPPSVNGSKSGSRNGAGDTLGSNIVPPPPAIDSASPSYGSGGRGSGFGGAGDAGSALAPPKTANGNNNNNAGVVVSAQPGSNVAVPGTGGKGSLAMSPAGTDKPGIGGSGGDIGIGHGEGSGSGLTAKNAGNPGAAKSGTGRGSDTNARGGTSSVSGPGGAGSLAMGTPAVPGVDVRGGSTIVTLPSFGSDAGGGDPPALPGRTNVKTDQGPAITIVASSRSGGAFDFYGKLPGDNYTVYVDTSVGTVVMQFAEADPRAAAAHPGSLTGPEGIRTNLPANLPRARLVVKCRLDASGNVKNIEVLEPGPATMTAKVVAALPGWKFRPAMRGVQPVEINAILGFNINTNDRY